MKPENLYREMLGKIKFFLILSKNVLLWKLLYSIMNCYLIFNCG